MMLAQASGAPGAYNLGVPTVPGTRTPESNPGTAITPASPRPAPSPALGPTAPSGGGAAPAPTGPAYSFGAAPPPIAAPGR